MIDKKKLRQYRILLHKIQDSYDRNKEIHGLNLFTTYSDDNEPLYDIFVNNLPTFTDVRNHRCKACAAFVNKWGNAVFIQSDGTLVSAMFDFEIDGIYGPAVKALRERITSAMVTGKLPITVQTLGYPADVEYLWRADHMVIVNARDCALSQSQRARLRKESKEHLELVDSTREWFNNHPLSLIQRVLKRAIETNKYKMMKIWLYWAEEQSRIQQELSIAGKEVQMVNHVHYVVNTAPGGFWFFGIIVFDPGLLCERVEEVSE